METNSFLILSRNYTLGSVETTRTKKSATNKTCTESKDKMILMFGLIFAFCRVHDFRTICVSWKAADFLKGNTSCGKG